MLYFVKKSIEYSIILINVLLRFLVIWLVKKIGVDTRSNETRQIMIIIFVIQFINTGPLLILSNASLAETGIPII